MIAAARRGARLMRYPALAGASFALVFLGGRATLAGTHASSTAPDFTLDSVEGGSPVALSRYAGKTVVLNFWASWCGPCRQEAATLERASKRWSAKGVEFVGVDVSDSAADARAFIGQHGIDYAIGADPDGETARSYGLAGLPDTVIISGGGEVVERIIGPVTAPRLAASLGGV